MNPRHLLLVLAALSAAFLLLPASAYAQAVARYGDAARVPARAPLAADIERLALQIAVEQGRSAPVVEPRLEAALALIAPRTEGGAAPPSLTIAESLWLVGLVEPLPYLLLFTYAPGGEAEVLGEVRARLAEPLAEGRYRRVAAYVADVAPGQRQALVALQESFVAVDPLPRQLPVGKSVTVSGKFLGSHRHPELFVTAPGGRIAKVNLRDSERRFTGQFSCAAPGRHQIELVAEGAFGAAVLANFPIHCGEPAPARLSEAGAASARRSAWRDAAEAEVRVFELLNRDRQAQGLPTLTADPQLQAVARAHAHDMREHGFVGHVSPTTGSPQDRVRRAGLPTPKLLLENVAVGGSPEEVEESLLGSPAHRANLLHPGVTRVGVGAEVEGSGSSRQLFVVQLFARFPEATSAASAAAQLHAKLDELRRRAGVPLLAAHPVLDQVAERMVQNLASGRQTLEQASTPGEEAERRLEASFSALRSIVGRAIDVAEVRVPASLQDAGLSHVGVAAAPGRAGSDTAIYWVIIGASLRGGSALPPSP